MSLLPFEIGGTLFDVSGKALLGVFAGEKELLEFAFKAEGFGTLKGQVVFGGNPPDVPILDDPVEWLDSERFRRVMRVNPRALTVDEVEGIYRAAW